MIADNLVEVEKKIALACERAGRRRDEVILIAVSKTQPISCLSEAYDAGIREFGENKVQELVEKEAVLSKDINWHMIGHLQTNKIKYISEFVHCIHSVDSVKVLQALEKEGAKKDIKLQVLLEINIANEESKYGFEFHEVENIIEQFTNYTHLELKGFMSVAPFVKNPEENRAYFKKLHELFVDIRAKNIDNVSISVLSMGMSNDYEVAIEEGSTCVRIGTDIFGRRNYNF